jgi:hypothetical protein
MKKNIVTALLLAISISIPVIASNVVKPDKRGSAIASESKSGKWVAEYGGGSTPFRCVCTSNWLRSQCVVGDTTSDLSKCE